MDFITDCMVRDWLLNTYSIIIRKRLQISKAVDTTLVQIKINPFPWISEKNKLEKSKLVSTKSVHNWEYFLNDCFG